MLGLLASAASNNINLVQGEHPKISVGIGLGMEKWVLTAQKM